MLLGCAAAGPARRLSVAVAGRYAGDTPGVLRTPTVVQGTTFSYTNDSFRNRWGDYTSTIVDPADDMTMWTFQKYPVANNVWQVRVFRLGAPGPAVPVSCSPGTIAPGTTADIEVIGDTSGDVGFFDTETGMSRLSAAVRGGGLTVNSVTYAGPSRVVMNVTAATDAELGLRAVEVTNPDGQLAASGPILNVGCEAPAVTAPPIGGGLVCVNGGIDLFVSATGVPAPGYQWKLNGEAIEGATGPAYSVEGVNESDEGSYTCEVTNSCGTVMTEAVQVVVCAGDFDCNGSPDGDDIIAYFAMWDSGDATADVNGTGSVDGDDLMAFFAGWDAGC